MTITTEINPAKVIIFGLTPVSEVMQFLLTRGTPYQVVAFTVDKKYLNGDTFCELPVLPFEDIEKTHPPGKFSMLVCLGFSDVNQLRASKFYEAKAKGYQLIKYISTNAVIHPGVSIGENTQIGDQSIISPFANIGKNVIISPGCFIGHHSIVEDHCFLGANAVVLGKSKIGSYSILGANSTVKDNITIANSCIIGLNVGITRNTQPGQVYVTSPPMLLKMTSDLLGRWVNWNPARLLKNQGKSTLGSS